MPLTSPGGLSAAQNADIVAFMLKRAGFAAGNADFSVSAVDTRPAPAPRRAADAVDPGTSWYTEAQAARGKAAFYRHCALCHTSGEPAMEKTETQPDRGWHMDGRPAMRALPIRHYPTVYNLYQRIRDSMPGWDIDSATLSEKVDIVAYLLKSNKFPAGQAELSLDVSAMKKMPIKTVTPFAVEEGFEALVAGSRAPALRYIFGFNCEPEPAGCGKTDAAGVVTLQDDVLVANGRYHGMIYTEKKYGDFDWRFDYRFVRPPDLDITDEFLAVSSGYMLFVDKPYIWPKSIEVEGNELTLLAAHPLGGGKLTSNYDTKALARYRKAIGTWSSVRIVSVAGDIKIYLNDGLITHVTAHSYAPGYLGFQYQGGHIEWRRIRIKG
jgi:mono/diheme cytochrome c family protein